MCKKKNSKFHPFSLFCLLNFYIKKCAKERHQGHGYLSQCLATLLKQLYNCSPPAGGNAFILTFLFVQLIMHTAVPLKKKKNKHLFVNLSLLQTMNPVPQQWAFICHPPERSGNTKTHKLFDGFLDIWKKNVHLVAERRYLLPPVVEETGLVRLDDDNVKQVPPVLPYDVVHSSIAERRGGTECWVGNIFTLIVLVNKQPGLEKSDDVCKTCLHLVVARKWVHDLCATAGIKTQKSFSVLELQPLFYGHKN